MKKVKVVKNYVIYELNKKEQVMYGFCFAPVLKEVVECYGFLLSPGDSDIECETLEQAISWAIN